MYLKIFALDLDGTLTENDSLSDPVKSALINAKKEGFTILLVTGRRLDVLPEITFFESLCEAIIVENGAAIYFPRSKSVTLPFGQLAPEVKLQLQELRIPLELGLAIAATWVPHDKHVTEILSRTGYAATIEYNKGAVMVLPPGATKGTGLRMALYDLGFSPHNVVAIGDAENDRSLFEQVELSVAVQNAAPEIRRIADVILPLPNGAGVSKFVEELIQDRIPLHRTKERLLLPFGKLNQKPYYLDPISLLNGNLGIFGSSRSGKSWLAGFMVEQLLKAEYQVCLIDPEGDYRAIKAFPQTLLLGGTNYPLPVGDVITLIEYSNLSLILDLSQYSLDQKLSYVQDLLRAIYSMRKEKGVPHWTLLDEAQYFCSSQDHLLEDLMVGNMKEGGMGLITYQPTLISDKVLKLIDQCICTRIQDESQFNRIKEFSHQNMKAIGFDEMNSLVNGQAFVSLKNTPEKSVQCGVVEYGDHKRVVHHVRHLHKYLRAPLPKEKRFYFHQLENREKIQPAASLWEFRQTIPRLPLATILYHINNSDFERWFGDTLNDKELARRVRKLARREIQGQDLQREIYQLVDERYTELEHLI